MYRNGAFVNLDWDRLDIEHGGLWERLRKYLGLQDWNPLAAASETRLDFLAKECVSRCRELLFSLLPIECLPHRNILRIDCPDFPQDVRIRMESNLTQAVCDHLAVTFSYRFLVENLEPKTLYQYKDRITHILYCTGSTESKKRGDCDEVSNEVKNAYKNFTREYGAFRRELGLDPIDPGASEDCSILAALKDEAYDIDAAASYEKLLKSELKTKTLPPPSAWFLSFFLSRRIQFRNLFAKNDDKFFALANIISGPKSVQDYQLLLPVETVTDEPLVFAPALYSTFVGIPVDLHTPDNQCIPDTEYCFKNSADKVTIPARLQQVFNTYLFERNFHLYAIAKAEQCLRKLGAPSSMAPPDMDAALLPFRVHAPLVQAQFLSFVSDTPDLLKRPLLLEQYIKRWNRFALPVIEELFIWGVRELARTRADVEALIQEWIAPDSTCERLNTIRLIAAKVSPKATAAPKGAAGSLKLDQIRDFHNCIVSTAFRLADNFGSVF